MFNEKPSALPQNHLIVMDYDILQSVSHGSDGAQDAENSRIAAIADELERLRAVYEAHLRPQHALKDQRPGEVIRESQTI